MKAITTFADAHAVLRPLYSNSRTKYDLSIMQRLMEYLGSPQESLRVVHVAGTSGKTSTAYYISALLEAAGATVGLTVSPHVDEVNERVQINRVPLPEADFCTELTQFMDLITKSGVAPSYFEALVAFAYWIFAKRGVDYAVVEVGLGGLLDGTNVVNRDDKVCVITDIGLDHTEILGDTIEKIALQKAGIIHHGNKVFMYKQDPAVVAIVNNACAERQASLQLVPSADSIGESSLPLFQKRNLGLAVQVANFVLQRDHEPALSGAQVHEATKAYIPARMERFQRDGTVLILDGSHNAQKLRALIESIRAAYPGRSVAALVAFVAGADSRWQGGVDEIMKLADRIIVTSFRTEQDTPKASVDPALVAEYCTSKGFQKTTVQPDAATALGELQQTGESVLLVAGSFYLLNRIRPLILEG